MPMNAAGVKMVESWDPARDAAAGEQCRGYGAPAVMRLPGRVRISWDSDTVMKVETEAGTPDAALHVRRAPQQTAGWQGTSAAIWQPPAVAAAGAAAARRARGGSLRVMTTNLQARLPAQATACPTAPTPG